MFTPELKQYPGFSVCDESLNHNTIGGNKYRKLTYILKDSNEPGILTYGSKYSSHCMVSAYLGNCLGVKVILLIITDDMQMKISDYPHLKLAASLNAEIIFIKANEAHEKIATFKRKYSNFKWIPGGGHSQEGLNAYFDFIVDLVGKYPSIKKVKYILLPYGTGTTALGILKGINYFNINAVVIGVSVSRNYRRAWGAAKEFLETDELANLRIVDDFAGEYGNFDNESLKYRNRFLKETGILVDPIYNIRTIEFFYKEKIQNCLIMNTGGQGNNFLL
jgi:1-aminocyclopropane-1-carboxylate deaminase/D-cysteine desulfhydrase-like pyridoxal-dependent ACC family enzyme